MMTWKPFVEQKTGNNGVFNDSFMIVETPSKRGTSYALYFVQGRDVPKYMGLLPSMQEAQKIAEASINPPNPITVARSDGETVYCYACNEPATSARVFHPKEDKGALNEQGVYYRDACYRHSNRRVRIVQVCMYCGGKRPTLDIDGDFAHKKCHEEASK